MQKPCPAFDKRLRRPDFEAAHSNLLTGLNYDPDIDPERLLDEHRRWAQVHERVRVLTPCSTDSTPDRRLRVGYVSPDFRHHAVAHFLKPIFAHHDKVEVYCYAEIRNPDAVTGYFQSRAQGWRSTVGYTDEQVAEQVRRDQIDILVDLAGHTFGNRLAVFAYKPAPVQITYLGYPSTTGLSTIDYRLTDPIADPPGEQVRHTETLVRLPRAFCYAPPENAPLVGPLPAATSGHVTFGSFHSLSKLNSRVIDLWCTILRAVPSAQLLIFRDTLRGSALDSIGSQFGKRGIDPDRVLLSHIPEGGKTFLSLYHKVDIALDPFPWSGHTTTCEALWMGVPVITLYGDRYAGRMAACVLAALDLQELIADTFNKYLAIAVDWATDLDRRTRLRLELRERMLASPLCDGRTFTLSLEETYRQLWRRWCATR